MNDPRPASLLGSFPEHSRDILSPLQPSRDPAVEAVKTFLSRSLFQQRFAKIFIFATKLLMN
jgi:hypothetical protein